jgi:hypothetical protein
LVQPSLPSGLSPSPPPAGHREPTIAQPNKFRTLSFHFPPFPRDPVSDSRRRPLHARSRLARAAPPTLREPQTPRLHLIPPAAGATKEARTQPRLSSSTTTAPIHGARWRWSRSWNEGQWGQDQEEERALTSSAAGSTDSNAFCSSR